LTHQLSPAENYEEVLRLLRTRFLVPLIALCALATVAVAVSAAAAAPQAKKPPVKVTNVSVVMHDFFFTLSKTTVPRGKVIFTVINKGNTDHDFVLATQNKQTPVIGQGETAKLVVTFTKPGKFLYLCSVGEHFLHGMKGYLTVK
jgi:plastocyanin